MGQPFPVAHDLRKGIAVRHLAGSTRGIILRIHKNGTVTYLAMNCVDDAGADIPGANARFVYRRCAPEGFLVGGRARSTAVEAIKT